ncbi:M20 aminoacylase family protein [Parasphingorhabdus sp.]|uniref:M20 aminoacylase family protein n=1 Tax=Parasphingorhabdus sp. TaxID=2709688 RepID=UPI003267D88D
MRDEVSPAQFFADNSEAHVAVRRDLHRHPETAFEEERTAGVVAQQLESFGLEVHRGLARTGVVGVLTAGQSDRAIGLRADMDALPIQERNSFDHCSAVDGKMHACGHDGHTAMLLAAAQYLSEHTGFDGTIYFIFQPAEENEGGGRVMVEEGLFEKFPMSGVYGMHNIPGIPLGGFAVRAGAMMAGYDRFDITISGVGGHAAMPDQTVDPVLIAAQLVTALQSVVSRNIDPMQSAVLSVTRIESGDTYNVIPETATLAGTVRYFDLADQQLIETRIHTLCTDIAKAFGGTAEVNYRYGYPPTINSNEETDLCLSVLRDTFGDAAVDANPTPLMAGEDFAFMLQERPGCYIWAGNGAEGPHACMVHNPAYDFNDDLIPLGARYWVSLARAALPNKAAPPS